VMSTAPPLLCMEPLAGSTTYWDSKRFPTFF
jgi:hypothetical protein